MNVSARQWFYLSMGALALFLLYILSRRISVNEFSLHLFYRNRLVRTFLGASNLKRETKSNRFTGFALDDDLPLGSLQQGNFDGPYPIWGTALNLTSGEDLAWQKRKATSFIYSPLFCGWDYFSLGRVLASGLRDLGYRAVAACTQDGEGNGKATVVSLVRPSLELPWRHPERQSRPSGLSHQACHCSTPRRF